MVDGPHGWSDEIGYGAAEVGRPAFVVVTGTPLFTGGERRTLVRRSVVPTSTAIHLYYDVEPHSA